jgi:hypothetical protein
MSDLCASSKILLEMSCLSSCPVPTGRDRFYAEPVQCLHGKSAEGFHGRWGAVDERWPGARIKAKSDFRQPALPDEPKQSTTNLVIAAETEGFRPTRDFVGLSPSSCCRKVSITAPSLVTDKSTGGWPATITSSDRQF